MQEAISSIKRQINILVSELKIVKKEITIGN